MKCSEGLIEPENMQFAARLAAAKRMRGDLFLMDALLGPELVPMAHLLVPSWLGCVLWNRHVPNNPVARRMDWCFHHCAGCGRSLRERRIPYQVAVRLVVGAGRPDDESSAWRYEIIIGLLCGACQTVPRYELVVLERPDAYSQALRRVIQDGAFAEALPLDDFYNDDERHDRVAHMCHAVVRNYAFRLERIRGPEVGAAAWMALVRWRRDAFCDHCGLPVEAPVTCTGCGITQWCAECELLASVYHPPQCETLVRGRLLDPCAGWFIPLYNEANPYCSISDVLAPKEADDPI